jgi:hypothetical protein
MSADEFGPIAAVFLIVAAIMVVVAVVVTRKIDEGEQNDDDY